MLNFEVEESEELKSQKELRRQREEAERREEEARKEMIRKKIEKARQGKLTQHGFDKFYAFTKCDDLYALWKSKFSA